MDEEPNNPAVTIPKSTRTNFLRPINPDSNLSRSFTSTSSSSSSSFSSSSPPDFIRNVQAAFKRHRAFGTMQSNSLAPRRVLLSTSNVGSTVDTKKTLDEVPLSRDSVTETKNMVSVVGETQPDASITPPSVLGATNACEESFKPCVVQRDHQPRPVAGFQNNNTVSSLPPESQRLPLADGQKKVQFLLETNARSQGADDRMVTGTDYLLSHIGSLALAEMDWDSSSQVEASTAISHDLKQQNLQSMELDISLRSDGGISSLLAKRTTRIQDQLHEFRNFLQSDLSHPMTQSSVVGSSCATTTILNSASAPNLNSTTHCSQPHQSSRVEAEQKSIPAHASSSILKTQSEVKEYHISKEYQNNVSKERNISKDFQLHGDKSMEGNRLACDIVPDIPPQAPSSKDLLEDAKLEPSKPEKQEKVTSSKTTSAPRKKNYDADFFFKVNGKLYQRLGKIGSGGSSEVHKVISSDCKIFALKKIKLKGRDYATAYGFCQEIEYLNKLKGKNNIIQLIDYEVTDKTLLQEVMNGSVINKDGRVKDDGYIYMVLEYGEIDLAHMLSQKWKEIDGPNTTIDENWLRFYWQQILQAVNTIHEERIVHSDLKPANFLLVRGSLKLIDFGIAKAIMSDTTNIQRDSQVGTLSYMSPEAFMCNETDANGNTIKCGRPSDIWSLGCILYQMVYGRTPFSEYKTFWAKFKVITDPNHEITYEPVSNLWLLDLMKKCLAWDRNERWRIPQLLRHPFIVPPIPPEIPSQQDQSCKLVKLINESCKTDPKALMLCVQLQQLLIDPRPEKTPDETVPQDQQCKLLREVSKLCFQLQEHLTNTERGLR